MKKIIPLLLSTALLLSGCSSESEKAETKQVNSQVEEHKEVYIMGGKIESSDEVKITSRILGRVSHIAVDLGSKVEKGQPIIYLDTNDIQAQVRQAEAGVNTAQANLDKAQSGARPELIAQAQANLKSTEKAYGNSKANFERTKQLHESGAVSQQQMESAEGQFTLSESQYESAKEQLNILSRGETKETIRIYESQVKQAQAVLELAKAQLDNGIILSPVSGIVSEKSINEGEVASPGVQLATIVGGNNLYVNAYMPSRFIEKIKENQKVIIKVSEIPEKKFEGRVSIVNPSIDSQGKNILVRVEFTKLDTRLKSGMFAEIALKK